MSAKNILGLDLGTTSIGFAHIVEGETADESRIERIGVRVNPLSTDEQTNFEKGKAATINADRTLRRGMRRNLDRFQLRRENLIEILKEAKIISEWSVLTEDGPNTTFQTWHLRAKAVTDRIEKDELARVLLAINKKRGYKSNRKLRNEDEGQAIDGMAIAKRLYEENLTPGQLTFQLLKEGMRYVPDFYRSDLQSEFDKVWNCQKQFHPEVFTDEFYNEIKGKGQRATSAAFWGKYKFNIAEIKDLDDSLKTETTIKLNFRDKKRLQAYKWRSNAIFEGLEKEQAAYVITDINNNLNNSSGYLGAISDRSKELYFNKETVGQYLYKQLKRSAHSRLKNQVFYRQDYLDEFEAIWKEQSRHHIELTDELKAEVRDVVIFYQRKLRSQKGLVSFCEFESWERVVEKDGKEIKQRIGYKVAPKSSPLFQEFKIWQVLNNVLIRRKDSRKRLAKAKSGSNSEVDILSFDMDAKQTLFNELNLKGNLTSAKAIELLGYKPNEWELNYEKLEGNHTNRLCYEAYLKILELEGYDIKQLLKVKGDKDDVELDNLNIHSSEIKALVKSAFNSLNINTGILEFNAELYGKEFEQQPSYQLWHLLYSYEGDDSKSGNEKLYELLQKKFGFSRDHGRILANIALSDDYGSLSARAIRKIYPYIKENKYSEACELAGYRHSASSLTSEENANRPLKDKLELLKKNSLRNPVVEKILNQMVNVVNALIAEKRRANPDFTFDEIRIELARELKKNAKERAELTSAIASAKATHDKIVKLLQSEFGVKNPSRNDIIRYKLYEELKGNGYKDLYTDVYIPQEILFSKQIDVDHIIPQAKLFDDSFSNKTLVFRKDNLKKSMRTAIEYIEDEFGAEKASEFIQRVEKLYEYGKKNNAEGISRAKFKKLQKRSSEIGDGFIERDLRDSQYIAKKAKTMLFDIARSVVSTSGSITDRLREDWGLTNIMQELNFEKFKKLGLTEQVEKRDGTFKERIVDWSKRNDHRHHAMDALTVAFTKHSHIQYLNHLNSRYNESSTFHKVIKAIEEKETHIVKDANGNSKRVFNLPIPNFRQQAKEHLENVLVSHKAKNKVVTKNKNKIKIKNGQKVETELTPRGQLHKESVYGKRSVPVYREAKVGGSFDIETIGKVANKQHRELLLKRLSDNDNDPKKAFTGKNALSKKPIYLNENSKETLPQKVKLIEFESKYTIRTEITPDLFLDSKKNDDFFKRVEFIYDKGIRQKLIERYMQTQLEVDKFNEGRANKDKKKVLFEAFSNLDKNPIWLNASKGISIKRVTVSGVKNAEPLHYQRNHLGKAILDNDGRKIPVDFVSTGNNHHVAIYRDAQGNLQERIVSLFEAVQLVNAGQPVIDKEYNKGIGWQFLFTMKQNEYFVFPNIQTAFNPSEIDLLNPANNKAISPNLFRVQKLATGDYTFRHHLETNVDVNLSLREVAYKRCGIAGLYGISKVRINHIGQIVRVGED